MRLTPLLVFLMAMGAVVHKSIGAPNEFNAIQHQLLEKTANDNSHVYVSLQKDAGAVFRETRMAAQVAEGVFMKAFGLDPTKPEDVKTYSEFETGAVKLDVTPDVIAVVAKAAGVKPVDFAAKVINSYNPTDAETPSDAAGAATNANKQSGAAAASSAGLGNSGASAVGKSAEGEQLFSRIAKSISPEDAKALNVELLKSRQVRTVPEGAIIQKSEGDIKLEKARAVGSSILGLKDGENSQLMKTGIVVETDFSPGGTNNPTLGTELFALAAPQMKLLNLVRTVVMTSYHQEVLVLGKNRRTSLQLTVGDLPTAGQQTNFLGSGTIMDAADMDWTMLISDKVGLQYQGNLPGLETTITDAFTSAIATEPEDLGLNGTTDTYSGTFLTIRKGWYAQQVTFAGATAANNWTLIDQSSNSITTVMGTMDAMITAMVTNKPEKLVSTFNFVMSKADHSAFADELNAILAAGGNVLLTNAPTMYKGYNIVVSDFATTNQIIFTDPKNLVFGYVNAPNQGLRVDRSRRTKGMQIQVSLGVAYHIIDNNAMVISQA